MLQACDVRNTLGKEIHHQAKQVANLLSSSVPSKRLIANRSGLIRACDFKMENLLNTRDSPYLNRHILLRTWLQHPNCLRVITSSLQMEVPRDHWPDPDVLVRPKTIHRRIISKPARRSRKAKTKKKSKNCVFSPKRMMIYGRGYLCTPKQKSKSMGARENRKTGCSINFYEWISRALMI